jgi:2-polyprenyl-3-methyl-5-hydroxy-6-metoxy-1,4-benzoquinol methylase
VKHYFDKKAETWDSSVYRQERAKTIADTIKKQTKPPHGYRGMDFGCGTGLLGAQFAGEAGEFHFIDTSEKMIDQVRKKIIGSGWNNATAVVRDVMQDDPEEQYDLIMTLMALHHVEDHAGIIGRLGALLSSGGYLCIADLITEDGSFHQDQEVPHNGFDPDGIEEILKAAGLKLISRSVPFENRRIVDDENRSFPIFLSVAQKP